jgi:hypothetical protein
LKVPKENSTFGHDSTTRCRPLPSVLLEIEVRYGVVADTPGTAMGMGSAQLAATASCPSLST